MRFCHAVGPGYLFGELELILDLARFFEMKTYEKTSLLSIRSRDIELIAEKRPEVWRAIARLADTHEALAVASVDDLMLRDPRKRLAASLLRLAGQRWTFQLPPSLNPVPVTQQELSEVANLSRTVTAGILAEFNRTGLVRTEYGRVHILKPKRLSDIFRRGAEPQLERRRGHGIAPLLKRTPALCPC